MEDITTRVAQAKAAHPGDTDAQASFLQDADERQFPEFYTGMSSADYAATRADSLSQWLYWING